MDQFSAHLDRGWDLVQRGDPRGAEVSARRALEIDSQSPEAYNLLGYVAALKGEFEEAIDHYRQAIALDDTYDEVVDALLLKFDALLGKGEVDQASAVSERFPPGPFENPNHVFLV